MFTGGNTRVDQAEERRISKHVTRISFAVSTKPEPQIEGVKN
jgi:hypothetical protein